MNTNTHNTRRNLTSTRRCQLSDCLQSAAGLRESYGVFWVGSALAMIELSVEERAGP